MQLREYLKKHVSVNAFARRSGIHRVHLWRYISGRTRPRADVLGRIIEASQGLVTAEDLVREFGENQPKSAA